MYMAGFLFGAFMGIEYSDYHSSAVTSFLTWTHCVDDNVKAI